MLGPDVIGDEEECLLRDHHPVVHPRAIQPETPGVLLKHVIEASTGPVGAGWLQGAAMTETEMKLQDAGAQMRLAIRNSESDQEFRSCINGFLAAARSVTMVMERESAAIPELLAWYKTRTEVLGSTPLFRFFNSKRVYSIHKGVIQPVRKSYPIANVRPLHPSEAPQNRSDAITITITITITGEAEQVAVQPTDVVRVCGDGTLIAWYFTERGDWSGPSLNVIKLCETYFLALKHLVIAWISERHRIGRRERVATSSIGRA